MIRRSWAAGLAATLFGLALALASCSRHAGLPGGSSTASTPVSSAGGKGSAAPWAGHVLRGSDPQAVRQYLATVREVKPIRFRVRWNPATVAIDKDTAMRSLRSVSRDGATFVFASREPAVARLKPGSILWVWDIAVRKVDRVAAAAGLTRVHTVPVALNEAMPDADIEFDGRAPFRDFLLSARPADRAPPGAAAGRSSPATTGTPGGPGRGSSSGSSGSETTGFRPVVFRLENDRPDDGPPSPDENSNDARHGDRNDDENADEDADDEEEDHFEGNTYSTTLKGYQISIGYAPSGDDGLRFLLEARKAEEGDEGGDGKDAEATSEKIKEKAEELEKEKKQAEEEVRKLRQEAFEEQEGLNQLDEDYENHLAQMRQDDRNRKDPSYTGPSPPPPQTDSNGTPLTEQAMEAKLTAQYEKERSIELAKLQQVRQILGDAEAKKRQLREQLKELGRNLLRHGQKELYEIVSENFDVRFRANAEIGGFDVAGVLQFANGDIENAQLHLDNLSGLVKTDFTARLGKPGNRGSKIPVVNIPVVFELPMPVGGIPFALQLGTDFLVNVYLVGNHATLNLSAEFPFTGRDGFTYKQSDSSYDETLSAGSKPLIRISRGASPGVSAMVVGIQIPRVGFGLGVWGVSSMAYFDLIHVFTMTKSADVAMGLGAPPCLRTTYAATGDVGIETQVLPIPIESVQQYAKKLSPKKQVLSLQSERLEPPIKACEIGGP